MRRWALPAELSGLRVLDFGSVDALRSQTLWHAVAYGVSAGAPPTLSFARTLQPYVCLGYHRHVSEVDLGYCRAAGLPVYRRMVGGGPVYLDPGQLLFQFTLPARGVPAARGAALRHLLGPAVAAFQAVGVPAELDARGEIRVADRTVCGHGIGQVGQAIVVVGNLSQRVDYARATRVLHLANPVLRAEVRRLMGRYVAGTPVDAEAFGAALVSASARVLGARPVAGGLTGLERARLTLLDRRFASTSWLSGPGRPRPRCAQVKLRGGVWAAAVDDAASGARAVVSVVDDHLERLALHDAAGPAAALAQAVRGLAFAQVPATLERHGARGRRFAGLLAQLDARAA